MIGEWTLAAIAASLGAELRGEDAAVLGVSTDSRSVGPGQLFVALVGERFDGHEFLQDVMERGACAALVSSWVDADIPQIRVPDTLVALGEVARMNRERFSGPVIALTGSAGKTSTKEMLAAILSACGETLATHGNLNNEIGVPLTLLRLAPEHRYAVIEMGAGKPGDIAYLCRFAKPSVALLTNVYPAHVAGMGSEQGIADTKGAIYDGAAVAVINADAAFAEQWRARATGRVVLASVAGPADVWASDVSSDAQGLSFRLHAGEASVAVSMSVLGAHNAANATLAAAAALAAGVPLSAIANGLAQVGSVAGRLRKLSAVNGADLIDDTYNANPGSMRAAIDVLSSCTGRRILLMGDMAELGPDSLRYHREIGAYARQRGLDALWAVGPQSAEAVQAFGEKGILFNDQASLIEHAQSAMGPGDIALAKGSRSARMETIIAALSGVQN